MKTVKRITSFVITLLLASTMCFNGISVQAKVISNELTASNVVNYAKQFIGTPYKSGGTTTAGFDCSGFTMYVYNHFNVKLPHSANNQTVKGSVVSKSDLQIGDLVFFGKSINHVGIYVGNGSFIHSPKPGAKVKLEQLKYMPNYNTARRIVSQ